jgi:hypothetical protein
VRLLLNAWRVSTDDAWSPRFVLSIQPTRRAYSARTGLSPHGACCCSSLQRRSAAVAARFRLLQFVSASRAGLLIPKMRVRIPPGPAHLQGFCSGGNARAVRMGVQIALRCLSLPLVSGRCSSFQLVEGDFRSHSHAPGEAPCGAHMRRVSKIASGLWVRRGFESLPSVEQARRLEREPRWPPAHAADPSTFASCFATATSKSRVNLRRLLERGHRDHQDAGAGADAERDRRTLRPAQIRP